MFSLEKWGAILAGVLAAIVGIFGYGYEKGKGNKEAQDAKAAVKQSEDVTQAVIQGDQQIQQAENEKIDTVKRTGLE